jgi:hypothetical protein
MKRPYTTPLRYGWPALAAFVIVLAPMVIGIHAGAGWRLVTALTGPVMFWLIRPFRFGLLTPQERIGMQVSAGFFFAGQVVCSALVYFK